MLPNESIPIRFHELIKLMFNKSNNLTEDYIDDAGSPIYKDPNFYDMVYVKREVAKLLQAFDGNEEVIHVEYPGDFNRQEWPQVWLVEPWKTSYEHYLKNKTISERQRQDWMVSSDVMDRLTEAVMVEFALNDKDDAREMAKRFIAKNNVFMCKQLGVDITVLKHKSNVVVDGNLEVVVEQKAV